MRPKVRFLDDDLKIKIIDEARHLLCTLGVEIHNTCVLGLIGLVLMSWSLFDQGWIPVMAAMSVGQGIGPLSFALFLVTVFIDLRQAEFRPSIPPERPKRDGD